MINKPIETYFAYRLPHDTEVHFLKADGEWINNLHEITDHTVVFHDFSGDKILALRKSIEIEPTRFVLSHLRYQANDETRETYEKTFARLIKAITDGRFEKVILSRTKTIHTDQSALQIFKRLNDSYANTFNYIISNTAIGTWMGASPERLLNIEGTLLETMSLAGTKTAAVEWTDKEYREQALVTDTIERVLTQANCSAINLDGPSNLKAGKIEHLHTKISCTIKAAEEWKKIASLLHPTPAVCGLPTKEAKAFIPALEKHHRQFYTGFLGLIHPTKIQLFVNLRCMEVFEDKARLYIGGGIIANSTCESEWNETERKAETLGGLL